MNCTVAIDWKYVASLGTTVVDTILAVRMEAETVERVLTHAVNACTDYAISINGAR